MKPELYRKKQIDTVSAKLLINEVVPRLQKRKMSVSQSPIHPLLLNCMAACKVDKILDHAQVRKVIDMFFYFYDKKKAQEKENI